jgi:copper chaperone CopZ
MKRNKASRSKHVILAAFSALLLTAMPGFSQVKSSATQHDRANVLLQFAKDGTVGASCSEELGLITQTLLQVDGVENVKVDAKNNGVQVSYDPRKTTPEKIVVAFNKENPDTPLQSSNATEVGGLKQSENRSSSRVTHK